jgi:hypothetical protein
MQINAPKITKATTKGLALSQNPLSIVILRVESAGRKRRRAVNENLGRRKISKVVSF